MAPVQDATSDAPVVVIGAGPAGLTAALELVRRDKKVVVLVGSPGTELEFAL